MEKDLIFNTRLPDYQIIEDEPISAAGQLAHLPKDILRSGTIESLISQNEDLMARLKIMVRRLAQTEDENNKLAADSRDTKSHFTSLSDQILILKEKDELWKKRTRKAEEELEKIKSEAHLREIEFAELRSDLLTQQKNLSKHKQNLENEVYRLRRYRQKIHHTVRPMLNQKDDEIYTLQVQLNTAAARIQGLEGQIEVINQQSQSLIRNAKIQIQTLEEEKRALISSWEQERADLKLELKGLGELNTELNKKADALDRSLERQDYLENRVISLERQQSEQKDRVDQEVVNLQGQMVEWRRRAHEAEAQRANLQGRVQESENRAQNFQELASRLTSQMEALRTLWTENSSEVDRLRAANYALEKLNAELCAKLNESRNSTLA